MVFDKHLTFSCLLSKPGQSDLSVAFMLNFHLFLAIHWLLNNQAESDHEVSSQTDGYRSLVFIYHKNKASSCKLDQETVMARSNSLFVLLVVALSLTLGAESRLYRPLLDEGKTKNDFLLESL